MGIAILLEPTPTGFRASTGGPLDLVAEAATDTEAMSKIQEAIAMRIAAGAELVDHPLPKRTTPPNPLLAQHPLWNEWLAAVQDFQQQQELADQAQYNPR